MSESCLTCGHAKEVHLAQIGLCDYCRLDKRISTPCSHYEGAGDE